MATYFYKPICKSGSAYAMGHIYLFKILFNPPFSLKKKKRPWAGYIN